MICSLSSVPELGTHSVELSGFPILLARCESRLVAYVNACPHQFLPLDYRSKSVLSSDGRILRCTNHGAGFSVQTGDGVEGLGIGTCLCAIPVTLEGAAVGIAPGQDPD